MSVTRFYRFSLWLPVFVPVAVIVFMNVWLKGLGLPKPDGLLDMTLESVAYSLIYGGLPYIALAIWAARWIRGRDERQIRRLMLLAPVLMIVVFTLACFAMGLVADRFSVWLSVASRGATIIVPLGYSYVALTVVLRLLLGSRLTPASAA